MDYKTFMELTDEERREAFISLEDFNTVTAERDSFKSENDTLRQLNKELTECEKKTKELNFTLARKLDTSSQTKDPVELLHDMFDKERKTV